ncbi:hypothetical protein TPHA_0G01560 [Tetrapisispora phaffii CBS 4417]|uniref:leucine--tRNA ligase n=1 Tax=Tetrapisispora phaffii (strain ATCC 24235 / CBS 4417 / NBRC 1672 / NRRL Y-8282 / UCD 70-5) TaxID=1071381 RepID=G8BVR4_TETPH|nr:hypothetical protein TPHA_0G01560 [Tetrapisispora phaffii CBS 4417]CCE63992.1 hypothetical protein TPHA_0G01560 [Tetrapisispora phaffii CBS 4417]
MSAVTESKGLVLENTSRRDALIAIEKKYQKLWSEEHQFEIDAPSIDDVPITMDSEELHKKYPKFMSSMAYPYMNGVLHAGHCFTLSKVEFSVGFERMNGKRALFPLGFHCTGMPILACADKLKREAEIFGSDYLNVPAEEDEEVEEAPKKQVSEDVTKFKATKSKAQAKKGRGKYQFEIMLQLGIAREDIKKFADSKYWLDYFPPLCQQDCSDLGARIDWRRSYITTDRNPYYDAFIRWQMNKLKEHGKIKFGERNTIYSEKDGQPCMDHDRQTGEGVTPQEYVAVKIAVTEFSPEAQKAIDSAGDKLDKSKKFYFIAATLRPETMYGQTCCFVSPKIDYGICDAGDSYYITTERAFKNMSYQKLTPTRGSYKPVLFVNGQAFIGSKIHAPISVYPEIRILPMNTVIATKGTGVVTCVPSNSPDDYITMKELQNKPEYYGIDPEWVNFEPLPIIKTEKYGDFTAQALVEEKKIQSPKDINALAEAKKLAYKEDFYSGIMTFGKYTGEKVEVAKDKVKNDMITEGVAFVYNEPESQVVSRSGDECIVSLEDQWYLDYGEESWRKLAEECLQDMQCFSPEVKNAFEGVLDWLKNWAVSRTYGLGSKLPWDPKYLVESLSDSTIYQSFYTIAHLLFSDFYGAEVGPLGIKPEQMTDEVFDYIFQHTDDIESNIPIRSLQTLRREFEYFYPLDVSISGKDLIPNHLTFFIYTHVALFPKKFWPKGIRANGHLMLNTAKMSKSTGNFMTLEQLVEKYGADASRIALADAGDTIEDANLDESNANAAILRLFNLKEWAEEMIKNIDSLRSGPITEVFDIAFENEMNSLVEKTYEQYTLTNYKNALKYGLFDFQASRDYYRDSGETMHKDLVLRYIETQALLLAPVTPHFSDFIYRELLKKEGSVQNAKFPRATKPVDQAISASLEYIRDLQRSIREAEGQGMKKKKGKPADLDSSKPARLTLLISENFPEWQNAVIEVVRELFESQSLNDNKKVKEKVEPKEMKRAMPFISLLKQRLANESADSVFNRELLFNEVEIIKGALPNIQKATQSVSVEEVKILSFPQGAKVGKNVITGEEEELPNFARIIDNAVPGTPGVILQNL